MSVAYALAFVSVFVLLLVIGGMFLEGIEARRDARRRNHVKR